MDYQYTIPLDSCLFIPPAGDYNHCYCQPPTIDNNSSPLISGIYDHKIKYPPKPLAGGLEGYAISQPRYIQEG